MPFPNYLGLTMASLVGYLSTNPLTADRFKRIYSRFDPSNEMEDEPTIGDLPALLLDPTTVELDRITNTQQAIYYDIQFSIIVKDWVKTELEDLFLHTHLVVMQSFDRSEPTQPGYVNRVQGDPSPMTISRRRLAGERQPRSSRRQPGPRVTVGEWQYRLLAYHFDPRTAQS